VVVSGSAPISEASGDGRSSGSEGCQNTAYYLASVLRCLTVCGAVGSIQCFRYVSWWWSSLRCGGSVVWTVCTCAERRKRLHCVRTGHGGGREFL